ATAPALPPPPPSGSVTVLVNLTAPAGVSSAGLAPALLRTAVDRPAETVSLPSGVLLALGTAPVGGIKESTVLDTPTPADHVLVRLPELPSARPQPLATVAIPRGDSGATS